MHTPNTTGMKLRLALLAGLVLAASAASAASQCKGMQQNSCVENTECTWVNGYTRKDGRQVASHCKLRNGKRSAGEADSGTVKLTRTQ